MFTLPTEINDTVRAFRPSDVPATNGIMALVTAVFIAMGQLNHAIHFYIYTLTGGVFRNELVQLFSLSKYSSLRQKKTAMTTATTMISTGASHRLKTFSQRSVNHNAPEH